MGKSIAIQAAGVTGTSIGKSLVVALLCRILARDGYRVAPFKALNLTNQTYKDEEGREFGYSQALQAIAAGSEPDYKMNPFTPKPLGRGEFELILEGKPLEKVDLLKITKILEEKLKRLMCFETFYERVENSVKSCLESLLKEYDIVCIEGSGPSKLKGLGFISDLIEIPNMLAAKIAGAPVVLLAESIDSALATYLYLPEEDKKMVKGIMLNRFRYKELEDQLVEGIGVRARFVEFGVKRVEKAWLKRFEDLLGKKPPEMVGYVPYFPELSKLPDLDPLVGEERVELEEWARVVPKLAERFRNKIDMGKLYEIIGI